MQVLGTAKVQPRCSWWWWKTPGRTAGSMGGDFAPGESDSDWPEVREDPGSGVLHDLAAIIPWCYKPGESCPFGQVDPAQGAAGQEMNTQTKAAGPEGRPMPQWTPTPSFSADPQVVQGRPPT